MIEEAFEIINKNWDKITIIELYDGEERYGYIVTLETLSKKVHELIEEYKESDPEYNTADLIEFLDKKKVPFIFISPEGDEVHYF